MYIRYSARIVNVHSHSAGMIYIISMIDIVAINLHEMFVKKIRSRHKSYFKNNHINLWLKFQL